jgi:Tfp pilus assembly protein PilN
MKSINLLPAVEQKELRLQFLVQKLSRFWFWIIGSLVVFFALTLATRFYLERMITDTQSQIEQNKTLLNSADYKDLQNQIQLLNKNIKEIKNLQSQHYYWSNALVQLANLVPADMQLNQVHFDRSTGQIDVNGQAVTRESVLTFWSNVIKSDYFKNINFPLANLERAKYPDFTYKFYVNPDKFKTE